MRGRGLPEVGGGRRGDQMVRVQVWTPQDLPYPLREALQGLREDPSLRPQPDEPKRSFFGRVRDAFTSQGS